MAWYFFDSTFFRCLRMMAGSSGDLKNDNSVQFLLKGGWRLGMSFFPETFKYDPDLFANYAVERHIGATVDTVKQVSRGTERVRIRATLPREKLVMAQTPQVFRYELLARGFLTCDSFGALYDTDKCGVSSRACPCTFDVRQLSSIPLTSSVRSIGYAATPVSNICESAALGSIEGVG